MEEIYQELIDEANISLNELELLYDRKYHRDMPFDTWLNKVIVDSFAKGVQYILDKLNEVAVERSEIEP